MNFKKIYKKAAFFSGFLIVAVLLPVDAQRRALDRTVARVNGEVIMLSELRERLEPFISEYSDLFFEENMEAGIEDIEREVLDRMIDEILLARKAREMDLQVTEADIERGIQEIRSQFRSEKEFLDEMDRQGFTEETFRGDVADQIRVIRLIEREVQSRISPPSQEDALKYYEENRDRMVEPERIRARHILITTEDKTEDEALRMINEIYEKAAANPDEFSELARNFSEGPTAPYGGDLGYFAREEMVEDFADAAFSLEIGQISKPVNTRFGYHIIKVLGRRAAERRAFDEMKDTLMQYLYQMRMEDEYSGFLQRLREEANIEITL